MIRHGVIKKRHTANCPALRDKRCACRGGYRAEVYSPRDKKKLRKTFTHKVIADIVHQPPIL